RRHRHRRDPAARRGAHPSAVGHQGFRGHGRRHPPDPPHPARHGAARPSPRGDPRPVPHDGPADAPAVRRAQQALRRPHHPARRREHGRDRSPARRDQPPPRRGPAMTSPATATDRILVVDDEPDIVALVVYHLAKAGYKVSSASTGPDALQLAKRARPSLIVLDLMLPGMSGFDVLAKLREDSNTAGIAVLMLTARKEEPDRIRGLELGADDYLTKPFSPQELVLRVGAILRRVSSAGAPADVLQIGPIRVDRSAHRVLVNEHEIELTPTEYKLLLTLVERR